MRGRSVDKVEDIEHRDGVDSLFVREVRAPSGRGEILLKCGDKLGHRVRIGVKGEVV